MADEDVLRGAVAAWLVEVASIVSQDPDPIEEHHGIESWQHWAGRLERLTKSPDFSSGLKKKLFDDNAAWQRVRVLALNDESIKNNTVGPVWRSNWSRPQLTLEQLFESLLPVPIFLGDKYFIKSVPDSVIFSFIDCLRTPTFSSVTIWPVKGIRVNTPLQLERDLEFRALTTHEKIQLLKRGIIRPEMITSLSEDCTDWYGLCLTERGSKYLGENEPDVTYPRKQWEELVVLAEDFFAALSFVSDVRVTHPGGFHIPPAVQLNDLGTFIDCKWLNSIHLDPFGAMLTIPNWDPFLPDDAARELLSAWAILREPIRQEVHHKQKDKKLSKDANTDRRLKFENAMATVIRRLYYAGTRFRPEDQLLDVMIAAETLYGGELRHDKTFRLSASAALLSEGSSLDRLETYREFNSAYKIRSAIVHGDPVSYTDAGHTAVAIGSRVRAFGKKLLSDPHLAAGWPEWLK